MKMTPLRGWRPLLAGTLLATAGAFTMVSAGAAPRHGPGPGPGAGGPMMMEHGHVGPAFDRMLRGVDATEEQRTQVRQIARGAADDLKTQREAARSLREKLAQQFVQPTVDAAAVESLRQQLMAVHEQTSRRVAQAMLDASRVLTPEQRSKLAQRMEARKEMAERHRRERESLDRPAR